MRFEAQQVGDLGVDIRAHSEPNSMPAGHSSGLGSARPGLSQKGGLPARHLAFHAVQAANARTPALTRRQAAARNLRFGCELLGQEMPGGRSMQQWEEANARRSAILRTNKQRTPWPVGGVLFCSGLLAMDANSGEPWSERQIGIYAGA